MSELQPVAFSSIESQKSLESTNSLLGGLFFSTSRELTKAGFTVIEFPVYKGDPSENVRVAEQIISPAGGLFIERFGHDEELDLDAAQFDRIRVANEQRKPVFMRGVVGISQREQLLGDIDDATKYGSDYQTLTSASGASVREIIYDAEIVETSPNEPIAYDEMKRRLTV